MKIVANICNIFGLFLLWITNYSISAVTQPPTIVPTTTPSNAPVAAPTFIPTSSPTFNPSPLPSYVPTNAPSNFPTTASHPDDPVLLSYSLDCSIGKLTMTFDSLISARTMDVTGIGFQAVEDVTKPNVTTTTVHLTAPYNNLQSQGNTTDLVIYLNSEDFARLKISSPVASSLDTTFLTLRRDAVFTPFNKANVEINDSIALQAASHRKDTFPPYVERFTLDMDSGILRVRFTEPVDPESFQLEGLTIQKRAYMGEEVNDPVLQGKIFIATDEVFTPVLATELVRLVNNHASFINSTEYDRIIEYDLGITNMNHIKAIVGLATSYETTFLSAWQSFVNDTSGNPVSITGFDQLNGLPVLTYYPDVTPPTLLYWDFNLNTGDGEIVFSETVYMVFFNFSSVIFTNSPNCTLISDIDSNSTSLIESSLNDSCSAVRLRNPFDTPLNNTDKVQFKLTEDQLNEIKALPDLLSTRFSSYLILGPRVVVDTSAAQNRYEGIDATPLNPRQVRIFSPDSTDPRLLSYGLDLTTRKLVLTFTETIKVSSIQLSEASLQSQRTAGVATQIFTFSDDAIEVLTTGDAKEIELYLTTSAFAELKAFTELATSIDTTFFAMRRDFITDCSRNVPNSIEEVASSAALQATYYIPDTVAPSLLSWYPDFTMNQIHLTFSKPVDFLGMRITLMNFTSEIFRIPSTEDFSLSDETVLLSYDLTEAVIQLSDRDGDALRSFDTLCASINSCFLSLPSSFVSDTLTINATTGESEALPLLPVVLQAPERFIADSIGPSLLNVSVNMDTNSLTFLFSEYINGQSLNTSTISMFTEAWISDVDPFSNTSDYTVNQTLHFFRVQLSQFAFTNDYNTKVIEVYLTRADVIAIQYNSPLATGLSYINISVTDDTVEDTAGLRLNVSSSQLYENGGIIPYSFEPDQTAPTLLSVYLVTNAVSRNLTLYFDEVVDINTLNQAAFLLISSSGATVDLGAARLVDPLGQIKGSSVPLPSRYFTVALDELSNNLDEFGLAADQDSTHVYVAASGAVTDISASGNRIQSMDSSIAIRDGVTFTGFHLNMMTRTLALEMSFFVGITSLTATRFTMRSGTTSTTAVIINNFGVEEEVEVVEEEIYTFTRFANYEVFPSGPFIIITLSNSDFVNIRRKFTIVDRNDIVLDISPFAARDVNGKRLSASITIPCEHFVRDTSQLVIESFVLNLAAGTIRINFNKEIELATVDVLNDAVVLHQSNATSSSNHSSISLRNITLIEEPDLFGIVSPNTSTILLSLNNLGSTQRLTIREEILLLYPLAGTASQALLTARKGFAYDLARPRNPLQGVGISDALIPSRIVIDTIGPIATSFDLDLDQRLLIVSFSEAVNMSTVRPELFKFLSDPDDADSTSFYISSDSPVLSVLPSTIVVIELLKVDIDAIMALAPRLLLTEDTTYLSILPGAVKDIATVTTITPAEGVVTGGNPSQEVLHRYALPVAKFTPDITPPELLWYNFSLQSGNMVMFFDEMINCSQVRPEMIVLQYREFTGTSNQVYQLSSLTTVDCSSIYNRQNDPIDLYVYFTLDVEDLINLKIFKQLAKTQELLYLRLLPGAVRDMFNNENLIIKDGMALPVTRYVPDTVQPKLLSFLVNAQHQLILFFNEPVDPKTMKIGEIRMQDARFNSTHAFHLDRTTLFRSDAKQMILEYNFIDDFYRILTSFANDVFHKQRTTFLRASSATISDVSGNPLVEIPRDDTIQLGPSINYWDLDMETGKISFKWSEAVNSSFSFVRSLSGQVGDLFVLQDSVEYDNYTLTLTTPSTFQVDANDEALLYTYLSAVDMINLKNSGLLGRHADLFLTVKHGVSSSLNAGDVIPYLRTVEVRTTNALPIRRYLRDHSRPECWQFDLDLDRGLLILLFDEPTQPQSLQLLQLTLFTEGTGSFVQLSTANDVRLVNNTQLQVNLSATDLNEIKNAVDLDGVPLNALVMERDAVADVFGNMFIGNSPDNPIPLRYFTPDSTPPMLLSWALDLSAYRLYLYFDERIDLQMTAPSSFTLLSTNNLSDPNLQTLQLTNFTVLTDDTAVTTDGFEIIAHLNVYRQDAYALQQQLTNFYRIVQAPVMYNNASINATLCAMNNTAALNATCTPTVIPGNYSVILPYLLVNNVVDMFGNVQLSSDIIGVSFITPDDEPLHLEAFDLFFNQATTNAVVTVYFSRVISLTNFSCADFKFHSEASIFANNSVTLHEDNCTILSVVDSNLVRFQVPQSLFDDTVIGQQPSSTFINVPSESSLTSSLAGNSLQAIHPSNALRVGPQLISFSIDANTGRVVYVFNQPMDITSTIPVSTFGFFSGVTRELYYLQASENGDIVLAAYGVGATAALTTNATVAQFYLNATNLVSLKLLDIEVGRFYGLISENASFFAISSNSYQLNEINRVQRLKAALVIPDDQQPLLEYIQLNMGLEQLFLTFDEPIRLETLQVTNLRFQAVADINAPGGNNFHTLTGGVATTVSSTTIRIQLSREDAATIKLREGLAKNQSTTFISFPYFTAFDYAGNALPSVPSSNARGIDMFINDTILPTLDAFVFDLSNVGITFMTFIFSEPVLPLSVLNSNLSDTTNNPDFIMDELVVQSRFASRDGVAYRLHGGTIVDINLYNVTVQLLESDVANMKRTFTLIRNKQSTYLVVRANFTSDLAGNPVVPYRDGAALAVSEYIADTASPELESIELDLDAGTITFVANEPIIHSTVDPTALMIQLQHVTNAQERYTLSSLSVVADSSSLSETVIILLSQVDQDAIKVRYPMAGSLQDTWISYFPVLMEDVSGNQLLRVYRNSPRQVTAYNADITRPLIIYYSLDMYNSMLYLLFSESIQTKSINLNELILQNIQTRRFGSSIVLNYTTVSIGENSRSNEFTMFIDNNTMAFMKFHGIGLNLLTSYLSWSDVFISDNSGNFLAPFWDASVYEFSPRAPNNLIKDNVGPLLIRWYCYRKPMIISESSSSSNNNDEEGISIAICLLYFDEPVTAIDANSFTLYHSTTNNQGRLVSVHDSYPLAPENGNYSINYSDYNRLVTLELPNFCAGAVDGLLSSCTGNLRGMDFYSYLLQDDDSNDENYFMAVKSTAAIDFAEIPNEAQIIRPRFPLKESAPDCSLCEEGQYTSTNCTTTSDRICSSCTSCRQGTFTQQECQPYHDTNCKVCGICGLHKYIAEACNEHSDVQCLPCTECSHMQYTAQRCQRGENTICRSCEICSFDDTEEGIIAQRECTKDKKYFYWQQANCCTDRDGNKIPCQESDRQRILDTAIDGRHHWTFTETTPKIDVVRNPGIRFPRQY